VPNCSEVENLVKFAQAVYEMCTYARTHGKSENRMPPVSF